MMERWVKNALTKKRIARFKQNRRAVYCTYVFVFFCLLSLTAEFWANSKPIVMEYQGHMYFPIVERVAPSVFDQKFTMVTDYRQIDLKNKGWAIWPLIHWDPYESNTKVTDFPSPPTKSNWFGTDDSGRDVFARLIYGFRYSIGFALLVWVSSFGLGIVLGAIMGFAGGKVDLIGQRVVEVFDSIPVLLLLITMVSIFGATLWLLVAFSAIFGWMMIGQYTRAEFLKLRKHEFVEAARAMGGSKRRMIFKHILPNALNPVITFSPFTVAMGIMSLANLDYLGFGLPPPTPSWGELLQQAYQHFTIAWWLAVFPSLALFITLVVLNFIGEGFRDAFDPRL